MLTANGPIKGPTLSPFTWEVTRHEGSITVVCVPANDQANAYHLRLSEDDARSMANALLELLISGSERPL